MARVPDGLWCAHTTDNVIVKYDIENGDEKERITLDPGDAYVHGLSIKDGELWYADANFAGKHNTATVGTSEIGILKV